MSTTISFGIDLGTTNSCISMLRSDSSIPTIIPLKNGDTIQSCVMLNEDGTLTVGKRAYEHRYEESVVYSVKRLMGSNEIITLRNGNITKTMTPVEVSAEILKEIVSEAEEYTGKGVIKNVTITVPAHFNDAQRRDTKAAGELAGLNVVSIINEPTSAGLLYGLDKAKSNQTILVYDLGGGTFDVSILKVVKEFRKFPLLGINMNDEYNKTAINILGNDGDVHLGGDDIDNAITDYIIDSLSCLTGDEKNKVLSSSDFSGSGLERLKLNVENAKKRASGSLQVNYNGKVSTINITGEEVIGKCYRPIFDRTYELVTKAMSSAGVVSIDNIVLVGGSTKSQIIRKMLKEKFPNINIMSTFEPDLSVGMGASVSSASVMGVSDVASITDVVPMSIGILVYEGETSDTKLFSKVLLRDSPLPCIQYRDYKIIGDDDSVLTLDIMQGESTRNINELLNIGEISLRAGMFETRDLTIEYKCDLNGVLEVTAISGNKRIPIDIKYSANETNKQINKENDLLILNKAQTFFYNNRLKKLRKAGVADNDIEMFTPQVVLDGFDVADSIVDNLISKIK